SHLHGGREGLGHLDPELDREAVSVEFRLTLEREVQPLPSNLRDEPDLPSLLDAPRSAVSAARRHGGAEITAGALRDDEVAGGEIDVDGLGVSHPERPRGDQDVLRPRGSREYQDQRHRYEWVLRGLLPWRRVAPSRVQQG